MARSGHSKCVTNKEHYEQTDEQIIELYKLEAELDKEIYKMIKDHKMDYHDRFLFNIIKSGIIEGKLQFSNIQVDDNGNETITLKWSNDPNVSNKYGGITPPLL